MYQIEQGSYDSARRHGVIIKPSKNPKKKIDVFDKHGEKIASIGAYGMLDYWKYLKQDGKEVANEHRRRYKIRHDKDRRVYGSNGYWANTILW